MPPKVTLPSRRPSIAALLLTGLLLAVVHCAGPAIDAGGPLMVHGFENATGNAALDLWDPWLTDMLVRDLWQADRPTVWSPQRSADFRRHLGTDERSVVLAAARDAGAKVVLLGRVTSADPGFLLQVDLMATDSEGASRTVQTRVESPGDLPEAVDALRDAIWLTLGVTAPADARPVRELTTGDLEAYGEFVAGEVLYHQGQFLPALERYRRAAAKDVDFAQAHYRTATARLEYILGDDSSAKSFATLAWAKREGTGERDRLAIEALRSFLFLELEEANATFRELRRRFPGDKEQAYFHAISLSRLGKMDEALALLEETVREDPGFLPAWVALANGTLVTNDRSRAREAAYTGLEINPTEPGLVETAAAVDLFRGDLDAVEALLEETVRNRTSPSLALVEGNLALLRGDVEGAMERFVRVRSPISSAMGEIYRGRINAGVTRLHEVSDAQIAAGNRMSAAVGLWFTGMVLFRNGQPDLALEQHTKALNFGPGLLQNSASLAVVVLRQGNLRRAEQILATLRETGPAIDPGGWEEQALLLEGELARARGEFDRAIEILERARKLAGVRFLGGGFISDLPQVVETLALTNLEKGDLDEAGRLFQEIVDMTGDRLYWPWVWLEAHVHLAELAMRDNRREDAAELAAVVRAYWGAAAGQNQPMVDQALERLDRIVPLT
jgi:tetratricopeptide (TPR) repeat protein